jgi:hypothetical protein
MKIRLVEPDLFRADRRRDGRTDRETDGRKDKWSERECRHPLRVQLAPTTCETDFN